MILEVAMDKSFLEKKIELVVDKLLNLGGADYEQDKKMSVEEIIKSGKCARDYGIEEWDWPQGVGLYGLYLLQNYRKSDEYMDFFVNWYERNLEIGLPSRNINTSCPYLTLVSILDKMPDKEKYEKLCLDQAKFLMEELPKTKDGGFQHVTSAIGDRNGVMLNNGQIWADTLFMAVLFLQKMGIKYDNAAWRDEATHQFLVHIKYLYSKQTGLFYHGFSFERNDNFGGIYWCRGNSWFTLGVTLFLEDADYLDGGVRQFIVDTFVDHAEALRKYQGASGLFHTVIDDKTSYEEVSGTAAMAAGLLRGIKLGILPEDYKECAAKAIAAICDNVDSDGTVLNVSAGTAMGMDAQHYKNIQIRPMAYGQSLTLVALCEAL
jgi:unsaturated rhamnogalacturonyl hydrolase